MKIQLRLMLLILPVFISIVTVISLTTGIISTSALKDQARENAQLLSRSYASQIDSTIKLYQNMSRDLGSASITAINIETTLQVFRKQYPQFVHIFYSSFMGDVLEMSPYRPQYVAFDLKSIDGWQSAFASKSPTISAPGVYFGEKSIIFFAPAIYSFVKHQEPRIEGVVALVLPLKELFREIDDVTIGQSGSLFVLNEKGLFLHHEKSEVILSSFSEISSPNESLGSIVRAMIDRKSGFGTFSDGTGSQYISFSPIRSTQWSLAVNGSYDDITAGINQIIRINILVIFLGLILAAVVLYFVVHSVVSPIEKLTEMAGRIGQGEFQFTIFQDSDILNRKRSDEVSQLITAFNTMTRQLDLSFLSLKTEIDERKKVEIALNQAQNYLNNIVNSIPSMLIGIDSGGNVTHWNKAAEDKTGIIAAETYGKCLADFLPRMETDMDQITESIKTGKSIYHTKKPFMKEGSLYFENISMYPLAGDDAEGAVIRIDDVTEKVRMEDMMIQSEKMLSVGGLAAGMAHEINNPLAGMMQTASVMENRLNKRLHMPANKKAAEKLGISLDEIKGFMEERGILRMISSMNESGQRIAEIVSNMLNFSRKSERENSSHNIKELLDKTLILASTDFDLKTQFDFKEIEIIKEYEENIPLVLCEGSEIQQVFLNLLRNGAQAMDSPGREKSRFTIRMYMDSDNTKLTIEIEDNGPGMDENIRKRVFEPFFTTKPVGVGTGLGLSVSYFIITENHRGDMTVESTPGKGTKFIIRLPVDQL